MLVSEALKFAEKRSAKSATAESTRSIGALSSNAEAGQSASKLLGAGGNLLPADLAKMIPAAQPGSDGNLSKFLNGDAEGIKAALGALGTALPPELAQLVGKASPLLTKGLESLLKDGASPDSGSFLNAGNLVGFAAQFLPPWAGDASSVGSALLKGDIDAALDSMLSKYLPPELKAVYDAIKNLPGGWKQFLADLFDNPKTPQGADGPWAARLSDIVVCRGGAGPIVSPGLPTVLIGGMPAARMSDIVICNSLPIDAIAIGEPTVLMGGLFAARREVDDTAHQGKITTGFPTVHIGKKKNGANLSQPGDCVKKAADAGAATISGSGMTAPLSGGCFGNADSLGFGDALPNSLGDFAKDQIGGLVSDKVGGLISDALGKSDQPKPEIPPQPKIRDNDADFTVTKKD